MAREGKCTNFGNCDNADKNKVLSIPEGAEFDCPECRSPLTPLKIHAGGGKGALTLVILLLIGIASGAIFWLKHSWHKENPSPPVVVITPAPTPFVAPPPPITPLPTTPIPASPPPQEIVLRLHGSPSLGENLIPTLVEAFLKQEHALRIEKVVGRDSEITRIQATLPGDAGQKTFEIALENSAAALSELGAKTCDIALASRPINAKEVERLRQEGFGDMTNSDCEHVVALDALAIVVHPSNPVAELSEDQLARIFNGQITDWAQVKGSRGQITVLTESEAADTTEVFRSLVLGGGVFGPARTLPEGRAVAEGISSDPSAIGFVELPSIGSAKAVAISAGRAQALLPNQFEIATEDYALSRRLYLYTTSNSRNPWVGKFVNFALSNAGQEAVEKTRLVAMRPRAGKSTVPAGAPDEYKKLAKDAERLDLNFRFRTASSQLDNKAIPDLQRIIELLGNPPFKGRYVLLFGFADSTGTPDLNRKLSKERADAVAQELRQRGISILPDLVKGFGQELPVDSNDTEEGKAKNRRVEVWLRQ